MRPFDYVFTAFRNLIRQKARTALTIVAIVIGAIVIILVMALASGAKQVFRAQLEAMGGLSLVTVSPSSEIADNHPNLFGGGGDPGKDSTAKKLDNTTVADFKKIEHVADVSPSVSVGFNKMYLEGGSKRTWAGFTGLEANTMVINIPIVAGRALQKGDIGKVVIGMGALRKWGYAEKPKEAIGKKIIVLAQGWYSGWGVDVPKPDSLDNKDKQEEQNKKVYEIPIEIVGVTGSTATDDQNFITLEFARELSMDRRWEFDQSEQKRRDEERQNKNDSGEKLPDPIYLKTTNRIDEKGYSSILIKADNPDNVSAIADRVAKMGYGAITSKEALADFMDMLNGLSIILSVIGGIALAVAGIGIINTMVMSMYERTYEIGVMRACGATRAVIRRLFTFEAALIGFWGGVFGLIVCYGLAKIANHYIAIYLPKVGVTADIGLTFPYWLVLGTLAFTTLIGTLAGIYPSFRAAKLDPVEALRYE